jgi:hypothetical protein
MVLDDFMDYNPAVHESWVHNITPGGGVGGVNLVQILNEWEEVVDQYMTIDYYDDSAPPDVTVTRTFASAQNFTRAGIQALVFDIMGDEAAEIPRGESYEFSIQLVDDSGPTTSTEVFLPVSLLTTPEWQQVNIDLAEFAKLNFDITDVKKVIFTFGDGVFDGNVNWGTVSINNMQLWPPRCRPEIPEVSDMDLNGDCIFNFGDIFMVMEDWLEMDYWTYLPGPVDPGPPDHAYWTMDEGTGDVVADTGTSGNNFHGERGGPFDPGGGATWTTEAYDGNALYFDAEWNDEHGHDANWHDYVFVNHEVGPMESFTMSVHFRPHVTEQDGHIMTQPWGGNMEPWTGAVSITMTPGGDINLVLAGCEYFPMWEPPQPPQELWYPLEPMVWHHYAMTFEPFPPEWEIPVGGILKTYINGYIMGEFEVWPWNWDMWFANGGLLSSNKIGFGGWHEENMWYYALFNGEIDDARIYSYVLSHEEIVHLYGGPTAHFWNLVSPGDLYGPTVPNIVDFRDVAVISDVCEMALFDELVLWP